ncbi:MAG: Sua5/YciO/YrdC/YwlC family protein [Pseudomonadota bacterium]|nr:Sua5/YciO/YrdC/YwlC family protein [Pseudomonadota bacterium]
MALSAALLRRVRHHVRRGGVIAYATESCFGFGCDPNNERALQKVLHLKRRPKGKGLIVIGDRIESFAPFLQPLSERDRQRVHNTWPGPHTWLIPAKDMVKHTLRGKHAALAVRLPAHHDARDLCHRLAAAIVSTSANRAGQQPIKSTRDCLRRFGTRVEVIPGRIGQRKLPSTIQDLITGEIFR